MPRLAAAAAAAAVLLLAALPGCRGEDDEVSLIQASSAARTAPSDDTSSRRLQDKFDDDDFLSEFLKDERKNFPPKTPEEAIEDFNGVEGLCHYWGWDPLPEGAKRRRIFYGTVTGNEGQNDLYELHFLEVSPFVDRIVAVDPKMTQQGHPRNLSLDMSLPAFNRFGDQLRHVELESPTGGRLLRDLSPEERDRLLRPGKAPLNNEFVLEQWTRAQLGRGFKDATGNWEMDDDDVVIVADSDEIPLRYALAALQHCEVPGWKLANTMLDRQMEPTQGCRGSILPMRAQVYEYFADCPTKEPYWTQITATLARCFKNGAMDFEDARTGYRFRGAGMRHVAARHLHNVGLSLDDIVFKYAHYVEPRARGIDSGLDVETNQEMMWRGCDPEAPQIGPGDWHMSLRPSNDFIKPTNQRGFFMGADQPRRGLDMPFAIEQEKPEMAAKLYWKGHAELENPFVGKGAGEHRFDH